MNKAIFLETDHLILKNPDESDFNDFKMLQEDPRMMKFIEWPRTESRIIHIFKKVLQHFIDYGFSQCPVYKKDTGEFIGRAGLLKLDFDKNTPYVELSCFILPQYWRQGFATELTAELINYAFDVLNAPRVYATVDPAHAIACKVCEKLGMKLEKESIYQTFGKSALFYVKYNPNTETTGRIKNENHS